MRERPVYFKDLGAFFTGLRTAQNWSQSQAAAVARQRGLFALTRQVLLRLERGQTKDPEPEVLRAIAALYGLTYEEVVRHVVAAKYGPDSLVSEATRHSHFEHIDYGRATPTAKREFQNVDASPRRPIFSVRRRPPAFQLPVSERGESAPTSGSEEVPEKIANLIAHLTKADAAFLAKILETPPGTSGSEKHHIQTQPQEHPTKSTLEIATDSIQGERDHRNDFWTVGVLLTEMLLSHRRWESGATDTSKADHDHLPVDMELTTEPKLTKRSRTRRSRSNDQVAR